MTHIWVPKTEIVTVELPPFHGGLDGFYEAEAFQCREMADGRSIEIPGTRRCVTPENPENWNYNPNEQLIHPNVILNQGLEFYGTGIVGNNQAKYNHVGLSSQAENITDTALISWLAYSGIDGDFANFWAQGSAPHYGARRYKYRHDAGFGGGDVNLNELGVGAGTTSGDQKLTSRALTRDGLGDPATLPVLGIEYLDVYYTRRNYPDHILANGNPDTGTGTIDIGGTSYDYSIRPIAVTDNDWGENIFNDFNFSNGFGNAEYATVYGSDAAFGAVTDIDMSATSQGNSLAADNHRLSTYTTNSYKREVTYQFSPDRGNVTGGIKGIVFRSTMGAYQALLDATVPKDSGKTFEWVCEWIWTRKTI